jgi:hypothetical protein
MCIKTIKYLLMILLFCCFLGAAHSDDLHSARERLQARLDQDLKACRKGRLFSPLLGPYGKFVSEVCKDQKNLARLVKRTPTDKLPDVLVNIFIDEYTGGPTRGEYPPMRDYLAIYGEPAAAPLMKRYGEIGENKRQDALRTLGEIGSESALPLIRSELRKKNLYTLGASAYAMRLIRKEAAKEDLLPLLSDPDLDPAGIPIIVKQLSALKDPGWYDIVLNLAKEGRIDFKTIKEMGSIHKYPESVVAAHLTYLLDQWRSGNKSIAACLLLQIHQRRHIKQFFPILNDLLRADFKYAHTHYAPLGSHCNDLSRSRRPLLLHRIEDTLTMADIEEWMQHPSSGWLTYFYLHELYHKKGGPPIDTSDVVIHLTISAYDDAQNVLLGEVSGKFENGVDGQAELRLKHSNEGPIRFKFNPRLQKNRGDGKRWVIFMPLFMIEKPVGAGYSPLEITVGSKVSVRTQDSVGKITRWEIRHIGHPPDF